jgi:hypothetical protein
MEETKQILSPPPPSPLQCKLKLPTITNGKKKLQYKGLRFIISSLGLQFLKKFTHFSFLSS